MKSRSKPIPSIVNRSKPPGKIIPELVYDDLETAVPWLCRAFGFQERLRIGNHRSQLTLGGESLIAKENPNPETAFLPATRSAFHSVMVQVEDIEAHFEHAVSCGAKVIRPPADYPFGERQYTVEDIGGHLWTFTQTIADIDPRDWGGVMPGDRPNQ